VRGNTVNLTDPSGEFAFLAALAVIAVVGLASALLQLGSQMIQGANQGMSLCETWNQLDWGAIGRWGIGGAAVAFAITMPMAASTALSKNAILAGIIGGATSNAGIGVAISAFSGEATTPEAVAIDAIIGGIFGGIFAKLLGPTKNAVSAVARSGYRVSTKAGAHAVRAAARVGIGGLVNTTQGIASRVADQLIADGTVDWAKTGDLGSMAKDFMYGAVFTGVFDQRSLDKVGKYTPHRQSPRHNMISPRRETIADAFDNLTGSLIGVVTSTNVFPIIEYIPGWFGVENE